MAKLLSFQNLGGRLEKTWLHTGDDGRDKFTIEVVQDVAPVLRSIERQAKEQRSRDFKFKAEISLTMLDDISYISSKTWGVRPREAFAEILEQRSDRSRRVMKMFTEDRDYRKLQAKHYAA